MPLVYIRFYEELNDFLPAKLPRKSTLPYRYTARTTVRDAIEAFNIPHTEVDLALVNGTSVGLNHKLNPGDRISVYPQFEQLDISYVSHIRQTPLRHPRFIVDVNLGKLAGYLRMAGFDTLYENNLEDAWIVDKAAREKRIILTRDLGVLKYRRVTHGYYVRSQQPKKQIKEVLSSFQLQHLMAPFTRCMACNGQLQPVSRQEVRHKAPPGAYRFYHDFLACSQCGKVYWKGSHYQHMLAFIEELQNTL